MFKRNVCVCKFAFDAKNGLSGYKWWYLPEADPGLPEDGAPTYDFANFSKNLHEIENILGLRGATPLDPPLFTFASNVKNGPMCKTFSTFECII